jgi:hypothetical protein
MPQGRAGCQCPKEGPGAGVLIEDQVRMPQGRVGCWCHNEGPGANPPGKGKVLVGQVLVPSLEG